MVNCYIHTERQASSSCVICGRGICRECSNWAAGDIYLCPKCWQENAPVPPTPERRKSERLAAIPSFGAGLSRTLYYAIAVVILVIGSWYVYATFIAPTVLSSGGVPAVVSGSPGFGGIWSRYNVLIAVSVSMFMVVLVGGELMLRTGSRQVRGAETQPSLQPASPSVQDGPRKSPSVVVTRPEVAFEPAGRRQSKPLATEPKVQTVTQTLPVGSKPSQPVLTQPVIQPRTDTRLVYCIYCGNKILSTEVSCNKCGKAQT